MLCFKPHKIKDTVGVTLWRGHNKQIELWFTKPNKHIPEHYHAHIDSHIIHVFGACAFVCERKSVVMPIFSFFKNFKVPKLCNHSAIGGRFGFVFLNVEIVDSNTSAAEDFVLC